LAGFDGRACPGHFVWAPWAYRHPDQAAQLALNLAAKMVGAVGLGRQLRPDAPLPQQKVFSMGAKKARRAYIKPIL
jgi:hypothetical protein